MLWAGDFNQPRNILLNVSSKHSDNSCRRVIVQKNSGRRPHPPVIHEEHGSKSLHHQKKTPPQKQEPQRPVRGNHGGIARAGKEGISHQVIVSAASSCPDNRCPISGVLCERWGFSRILRRTRVRKSNSARPVQPLIPSSHPPIFPIRLISQHLASKPLPAGSRSVSLLKDFLSSAASSRPWIYAGPA